MAWKQKIWNGVVWFSKELHGMIKELFLIWLAFVVISLIVMGIRHIISEPIKSPEVIIRDYYEAIENEDFETIKKLIKIGGINEEIRRSNEEGRKKEMVKWAKGFRERDGFKRLVVRSVKDVYPLRHKIRILGIKIWTKNIRRVSVKFNLFVNDGFIDMVPGWYEEAGIAMEAIFIMTKEGWKLLEANPSNPGSWDLLDRWLE